MPVPTFGDLLLRFRTAAGLTQAALAERAGLSVRAISDLERGINRRPRKDTFALLATGLELSPDERSLLEMALRGRGTGKTPSAGDVPSRPHRASAPPFVGRTGELGAISVHLAAAGPLLLLSGEPGIGKSRLLHEVAQRAAGAGWTVLAGGCHRRSGDEPFEPLLGALERHIEPQSPAQRRAALHGCAWLVRLLPELTPESSPLPAWTVPPAQERRLIFKALATYLSNVAGPRGTLLALDDLQWSGQDALDLLAALVRLPAAAPLSVIGAHHDTETPPHSPLGSLLADLAREGLARKIELGPLPEGDAAELVTALLAEEARAESASDSAHELRAEVVRRSEGVPFFLVSCALALRAAGDPTLRDQGTPWDVAETVRQRIAALPAPAPELLGAAAIVGRRVARSTLLPLGEKLGWDQRALLQAVESACRARLLVEDDDAFQFAHDLIREVVAADLSATRRTLLHHLTAEVLEQSAGEPPVEALAFHFAQAGEPAREVVYLERAGDRAAAMHAHAEAAAHFQRLARQLDALGRRIAAARAREKLVETLRTTGRYDLAIEELGRALDVYRSNGDVEGMARVGAASAWLHNLRGTTSEGLPVVTALLDELTGRGLPAHGLASLYIGLGQLYFSADRYRDLGEAAGRARELAHEAGDERLEAVALGRQAISLCQQGKLDEGAVALQQACRLIEAANDHWNLCSALNNLAVVYDERGAFGEALDCVQRSLALAERIGDAEQISFMTYRRGQEAFYLGDWSRARADYERADEIIGEVSDSWASSYPAARLARLAFAQGRLADGQAHSDRALAVALRKHDTQAIRYLQCTLAEVDILAGRGERALERLTPLLDSPGAEKLSVTMLYPPVAWARLVGGDVDGAEEVSGYATGRARNWGQRVVLADALRIQAQVHAALGRGAEAKAALEEALALARAMPHPYAEAKALYVYGLLLAAEGEPE
ncbi:MAG TPA: AAA family ATPase, partial [Ktedonobacterales bacterium]|nr:AAA family ATPase [Ktedonobacterales bacterium]